MTQERVFLAAARERVQEAEQRLTAVQAGGRQKLQQQQEQIAQLEQQLQEEATKARQCEWETGS